MTTIFLSIILLCAFTPIGFIHLGIIKATIIHIPIIIASIILGPRIGAFLGLVFGITSIINNTIAPSLLSFAFSPVIPVLGTDKGSVWALFIAIVPRVIVGVLPYFIYKMLHRVNQKPALFITGLLSTFVHTFLVMGFIALLFQDAYATAMKVDGFVGIIGAIFGVFLTNGISEAILAAILATMIAPPLLKMAKK